MSKKGLRSPLAWFMSRREDPGLANTLPRGGPKKNICAAAAARQSRDLPSHCLECLGNRSGKLRLVTPRPWPGIADQKQIWLGAAVRQLRHRFLKSLRLVLGFIAHPVSAPFFALQLYRYRGRLDGYVPIGPFDRLTGLELEMLLPREPKTMPPLARRIRPPRAASCIFLGCKYLNLVSAGAVIHDRRGVSYSLNCELTGAEIGLEYNFRAGAEILSAEGAPTLLLLMSPISIEKTQITSEACEVRTVSSVISRRTTQLKVCLIRPALSRPSFNARRQILFAIACAMFVIATGHFAITLYRTLQAMANLHPPAAAAVGGGGDEGGGTGPAAFLGDETAWHLITGDVLYVTQCILGDSIAIYRCWILWDRDLRIVVLPLLLLAANIVAHISYAATGYTACQQLATSPATRLSDDSALRAWITSFYALAVGLNTTTTVLTGARLWWAHRALAGSSPPPSPVRTTHAHPRLQHTMMLLVESAALYLALQIVVLAAFVSRSNIQFLLMGSIPPVIGITFTLITMRTALRARARSEDSSADRPHTIGSITMRGLTVSFDDTSSSLDDTMSTFSAGAASVCVRPSSSPDVPDDISVREARLRGMRGTIRDAQPPSALKINYLDLLAISFRLVRKKNVAARVYPALWATFVMMGARGTSKADASRVELQSDDSVPSCLYGDVWSASDLNVPERNCRIRRPEKAKTLFNLDSELDSSRVCARHHHGKEMSNASPQQRIENYAKNSVFPRRFVFQVPIRGMSRSQGQTHLQCNGKNIRPQQENSFSHRPCRIPPHKGFSRDFHRLTFNLFAPGPWHRCRCQPENRSKKMLNIASIASRCSVSLRVSWPMAPSRPVQSISFSTLSGNENKEESEGHGIRYRRVGRIGLAPLGTMSYIVNWQFQLWDRWRGHQAQNKTKSTAVSQDGPRCIGLLPHDRRPLPLPYDAAMIPDGIQALIDSALQVSSWLNMALFTLELVLCWRYFQRPARPLVHKIGVSALIFFDSVCTVSTCTGVGLAVAGFQVSDLALLAPVAVGIMSTYISASIAQMFLCNLYYILTGNRLGSAGLLFLIFSHAAPKTILSSASAIKAVLDLNFGDTVIALMACAPPLPSPSATKFSIIARLRAGAIACAATDVLIATSLTWKFWKMLRDTAPEHASRTLLQHILILTVSSGAIVATNTVVMMILQIKQSPYFTLFWATQGRVYSLTILRNFLVGIPTGGGQDGSLLSTRRFGGTSGSRSVVFHVHTTSSASRAAAHPKSATPNPKSSPAAGRSRSTTTQSLPHHLSPRQDSFPEQLELDLGLSALHMHSKSLDLGGMHTKSAPD
ncbi:hypothetical protein FB451DRAFT_1477943 [Mycena latifolia]|nr:hypothetical protein FB451DRAFT_1477943 [Mycena latifolia]